MYPYDRASNGLDACLPLWAREGGLEPMLQRLKDPALRERIKRDMDDANAKDWENQWYGSGGGGGVMLSTVLDPALRKWEGKNLAEIGKEMGKDPRDAVMDLVIADRGETSVIISIMREDDVRMALAHPMVAIGTDSGARAEDGPFSESKSHPRAWGSFPRILGKYVRDEKLITLEEAIRRFTSRPAARVGIADRGMLRPASRPTSRSSIRPPSAMSRRSSIRRIIRRASARAGQRQGRRVRRQDHRRAAGPAGSRPGYKR